MATIHDVLIRPRVTEKSNYLVGSFNQYVFEVSRDATKTLVKDAIEILFNVTVMDVNVINVPPKRSRRWRNRRVMQRRGAYKKAIVTLSPDDRIAAFEGVR